MFSGIIETQSRIIGVQKNADLIQITVEKPIEFNDLSIGDSIAVNGVCLTLEAFETSWMQFSLGAETLRVTGWTPETLQDRFVNLERSLRYGDRIHGHLVSGHVDALGQVVAKQDLGGSLQLDVRFPAALQAYFWTKGSWALNGVSLTINWVENGVASSCLIPETLRRTNLQNLNVGDPINIEVDYLARAYISSTQEVQV